MLYSFKFFLEDFGVYYAVKVKYEHNSNPQSKKNDLIDAYVIIGHRNLYFLTTERFAFRKRIRYKDVECALQHPYNHSMLVIVNTQGNELDSVIYFNADRMEDIKKMKSEFLDYLSDAIRVHYKGRVLPVYVCNNSNGNNC